MLDNKSNQPITVELYDYWTGKADTVFTLDTGILNLPYPENKLVGIYAQSYAEYMILSWEKAYVRFYQKTIEVDSLNQTIKRHEQWTNEITAGEPYSLFQWPAGLNHPYIDDWKSLDKILVEAFAEGKWRSQPIEVFSKPSIHAYPGAYSLLYKIADTADLYVDDFVRFIVRTLDRIQLYSPTKQAFLQRYFYPEKNSLKYDSAIQVLAQLLPNTAKPLATELEKQNKNSALKIGMVLPKITARSEQGQIVVLEYTTPYTVIDFWATWCVPCVKQMPVMDSLAAVHKNVRFISLSVDNLRDYSKWINQIQQTENIDHYWLGYTTDLRKQMEIEGLPHMVLVNRHGEIVDPYFPHVNQDLGISWIRHLDRQ
ncbi:MAG: TlpA disulfide reductase family protein [Salinivirgaceae bacterium]|nr:TlpA disulfide reductase family protein [Salinivirgaceae bacterium]